MPEQRTPKTSRRALQSQGRRPARPAAVGANAEGDGDLQLKLEGQTIQRNPHFAMDHRNLLHRIDPDAGTVTIDGKTYPLLDNRFPTLDRSNPYALTPDEARCIGRMKQAFFDSAALWRRYAIRAGEGLDAHQARRASGVSRMCSSR
ncbi:MAG: fructose-bisphosphatase class III [Polyangiaceae bacterium]